MSQCRAVANNNANEKMMEFRLETAILSRVIRPLVKHGVRKRISFQAAAFACV